MTLDIRGADTQVVVRGGPQIGGHGNEHRWPEDNQTQRYPLHFSSTDPNAAPALVVVGSSNIRATDGSAAHMRYAVRAENNLHIYGDRGIQISGGVPHGTHAMRVQNTLTVDLLQATLTLRGGNGGTPARGTNGFSGERGEHGESGNETASERNGRPGWDGEHGGNGSRGSDGGHALVASRLEVAGELTTVILIGGDGGAGSAGGHGGNGGRGGNGGTGVRGVIFGNYGPQGSWGGNGGWPLMHPNFDSLGSFAVPHNIAGGSIQATAGAGGRGGGGGNGGSGVIGGAGGTGGLPLFRWMDPNRGGAGGQGGIAGQSGIVGQGGNYGSLAPFLPQAPIGQNFHANDPINFIGALGAHGNPGAGGAGGQGGREMSPDGPTGASMPPGMSRPVGTRPPNPPPRADFRPAHAPRTIGMIGERVNNLTISPNIAGLSDEMDITVHASVPAGSAWLMEMLLSVNPANGMGAQRFELRHYRADGNGAPIGAPGMGTLLEIVNRDEIVPGAALQAIYRAGEHFTVRVANIDNISTLAREDVIVFYLQVGGIWVRVDGAQVVYTNAPVVWVSGIDALWEDSDVMENVLEPDERLIFSTMGEFTIPVVQRGPENETPAFLSHVYYRIGNGPQIRVDAEWFQHPDYADVNHPINLFLITIDAGQFAGVPERSTVTIEIFPGDSSFPENTLNISENIILTVSHSPETEIAFRPFQRFVSTFAGETARFNFHSPAHSQLMEVRPYDISLFVMSDSWEWDAEDGWVYGGDMDELAEIPAGNWLVSNWAAGPTFMIDTARIPGLVTSPRIGAEFVPRYMVTVSYVDANGVTISDSAFLSVLPAPLGIGINPLDRHVFTDDEGEIAISWTATASANRTEVAITRNNAPFSDFTRTGDSISITPGAFIGSSVRDIYTVSITAFNDAASTQVRDAITFEVYNSAALRLWFENFTGQGVPKPIV
jgi:hypothetical protein